MPLPAIPAPNPVNIPATPAVTFGNSFLTQFIFDVTPSQAYIDACNALAAIPQGQDTTAAQAAVNAALAADAPNQFIAVRYRAYDYANHRFPTAAQKTQLNLPDDYVFKIANPWALVAQFPAIANVAGGIVGYVPVLMALVPAQAALDSANAALATLLGQQTTLQTQLAAIPAELTAAQAKLATDTAANDANAVSMDNATIHNLQQSQTLIPTQLTALAAQITTAQASVTTAQAAVTAIHQQLGAAS